MSRKNVNPVAKVFDDLDAYREWCVEFGYVFNEKDLYKKDTTWNLWQRHRHGDKSITNNWEKDARRTKGVRI